MGAVGIENLSPGMELNSPLKSQQGRQLLPAGIVLTDKHINTLKIWGIVEVDIVGEGAEDNAGKKLEELPPELVRKTKELTLARFQLTDTRHPAVRNLAKLHLTRVANALYFEHNWQQAFEKIPAPVMDCPGTGKRVTPEAIVNDELELASLPEVFNRIVAAINDPKTSASHIAEVVSLDASLSAKLLRLVNSPYYGFAEKVDTLTRALALVGTDKLVNLALGISAVNAFKDISVDLFDMRTFWEHSVTCALTASWLAERVKGASEESYFVGGLLHDLGWLVMLKLHPDLSSEVLCKQKIDPRPGFRVEREIWGFDHAELGGMVLREWGLPATLVQSVMHHHAPNMVKYALPPSLIHVSDFSAHAFSTRLQRTPVPPLQTEAWAALGLTHNVFAPMATQVDAQLSEILGVFFDE